MGTVGERISAAKTTGRSCVGCELLAEYAAITRDRVMTMEAPTI